MAVLIAVFKFRIWTVITHRLLSLMNDNPHFQSSTEIKPYLGRLAKQD